MKNHSLFLNTPNRKSDHPLKVGELMHTIHQNELHGQPLPWTPLWDEFKQITEGFSNESMFNWQMVAHTLIEILIKKHPNEFRTTVELH